MFNTTDQHSLCFLRYNYTREDEEVYKEFLEIANEFIPNIVKASSKEESASDGDPPLLQNPAVYADLLRFYDGICEWEEGSSTPVLHVGWAQQFTFSLSKFDPRVRSLLDIHAENEEEEEDEDSEEKGEKQNGKDKDKQEKPPSRRPSGTEKDMGSGRTRRGRKKSSSQAAVAETKTGDGGKSESGPGERRSEEAQIKSAMEELVSKVGPDEGSDESPNPSIAALAQACSSSILNKDFLLSGGEPFTAAVTASSTSSSGTSVSAAASSFPAKDNGDDFDEFLSSKSNGTPFIGLSLDSMLKAESPADMMLCGKRSDAVHASSSDSDLFAMQEHVVLELSSEKMKGLRKILMSTKLNANAIKLQLTAQSQVQPKHAKRGGGESDAAGALRSKRTRRE